MEVYIIFYHTGQYEDSVHELDSIYDAEDLAKELLEKKNERLMELGVHEDQGNRIAYGTNYINDIEKEIEHRLDYDGGSYYLVGPHPVCHKSIKE